MNSRRILFISCAQASFLYPEDTKKTLIFDLAGLFAADFPTMEQRLRGILRTVSERFEGAEACLEKPAKRFLKTLDDRPGDSVAKTDWGMRILRDFLARDVTDVWFLRYDAPILAGWKYGFCPSALELVRALVFPWLDGQAPFLRVVLTGYLPFSLSRELWNHTETAVSPRSGFRIRKEDSQLSLFLFSAAFRRRRDLS